MKDFKLEKEQKIKSGFNAPENYFDTLSQKVMTQISNKEPKVISLWQKNKRWIYSSAAILVLSLSIPIANLFQNGFNEIASTTKNNDIETYLSYNSSITDDDIIALLDEEDIKQIELTNSIDEETLKQVLTEDSNIEYYIIN